ncbi:MAG: Gfo/Idh/MocA family oxidoreductase [Planctomycetes bacterium]|nr:Gfo/Idh/MocA family oxidoreductase [Planctomycetota bacterium]
MERPSSAPAPATMRVGIVGAGRSRQGLGPFLASAFERAGARVAGVAGRDAASAARAAHELARRLGHAVPAFAAAHELAAAVDLLVVAAPVPAHLAGLQAALAAGVPCLCEKPLVDWRDAAAGQRLVAGFRERGLLLVENCQWPFVLPAFFALYPERIGQPVHTVVMGLSPAGTGLGMVEDSLSHVLSLVQALAPLSTAARVEAVTQSAPGPLAEHNVVCFRIVDGTATIVVELHLRRCPEPPRPAWFAVDGCRVDRRLGPDYTQDFVTPDGRCAFAEDPLSRLVYGLLEPLPENRRERTDASADAISVRLGLFVAVLDALTAA